MFEAIPLKYLSLLILVVQNSALILMMRYTRANVQQDKLYLASTAVVMSEVIKTVTCLGVLYFSSESQKRSLKRLCRTLNRELVLKWRETAKLAFPAVLYLIQNNLQYVAASNLDAATFQVTYQLKILTTAFFSVVILKKNLTKLKWTALALLTIGIALVVLPESASAAIIAHFIGNSTTSSVEGAKKAAEATTGNQSNLEGFIAVLAACMLSGLAGVYFEKILKAPASNSTTTTTNGNATHTAVPTEDWSSDDEEEAKKAMITEKEEVDDDDEYDDTNGEKNNGNAIWIRNIQLSIFSVLLGLVFVVMLQDGVTIAEKGFFVNYTGLTWVVIFIQALGGLIVALVVKYADNILKGFATSISIILSSVISVWLFNFAFSGAFLLGATLVIYATYLYGL